MTWKFKQIKPMKARGKLQDSMWDDEDYTAEEKYDGDRRIAQFCGSYVRYTGTRESVSGGGFVEKSANLPHLCGDKPATCLRAGNVGALWRLEGTVLDGEVIPPFGVEIIGGGSKYVTRVMGSLPDEAIRKQRESGWLRYAVFDCLWYKGLDLRASSQITRRNHAERALEEWGNKYAFLVPQAVGPYKRRLYDRIVRADGEGVVLKHVSARYGDQRDWIKVKREATADVVVMGYKMGQGKYAGKVGAIVFGQMRKMSLKAGAINTVGLSKMGSCRGFDDDLMALLTRNSTKYKGRVFRITYQPPREPTGAFRHPRFDCWRNDKAPKDCVYDQEET